MKYMLLKNISKEGIPGVPPITEWDPEDVKRHIDFQRSLVKELHESGELVDANGLAWPEEAKIVVSDGTGAPAVTDGPFPESKEFLIGYWIVDVESEERAIEIAAKSSAAPGPGGVPIKEPTELRAVMSAPPSQEA